jgi:ammonia channel protein AmtB
VNDTWLAIFSLAIGAICGVIVTPPAPIITYAAAIMTIQVLLFLWVFVPAYVLSRKHADDPSQKIWSSWGAAILIGAFLVGIAAYSTTL